MTSDCRIVRECTFASVHATRGILVGNGNVELDQLPAIGATAANDNVKPSIPTVTASGFKDANGNLFDLNGNYLNTACEERCTSLC